MEQLTDLQELFCHEYLIDLNAKQAAIRAGYQKASAAVSASRNMSSEAVCQRIDTLLAERKTRVMASADYVLRRLIEIDQLDIANIVDSEGNLLPIHEWTEDWRLSVSALDISETKTAQAVVKKIKMPDKLKNLELLGKHTNVLAFKERSEARTSHGRELVIHVPSAQCRDEILKLKSSLAGEE